MQFVGIIGIAPRYLKKGNTVSCWMPIAIASTPLNYKYSQTSNKRSSEKGAPYMYVILLYNKGILFGVVTPFLTRACMHSTKITRSGDLGTYMNATCKHNELIKPGKNLASACFKSMDVVHECHIILLCLIVCYPSYAYWQWPRAFCSYAQPSRIIIKIVNRFNFTCAAAGLISVQDTDAACGRHAP